MTDTQRPDMLVPALIGGAVAGVLSGVPILSCLCCRSSTISRSWLPARTCAVFH